MKHPALHAALPALALALAAAGAAAKLPPPSDEAKAKAAETAAKTAWNEKVAAFQLCKSMDRVAAAYQDGAKKAGKAVPSPVATAACADPGPFEFKPPADKPPIEQAGAHSPPPTATQPPSTTTPAAATSPTR
jgi:hypothetical protein